MQVALSGNRTVPRPGVRIERPELLVYLGDGRIVEVVEDDQGLLPGTAGGVRVCGSMMRVAKVL